MLDQNIKGTVDVAELMGSSIHLHLTVDGKDIIVIVPTQGDEASLQGKDINIAFSGNTAHIFSKENDKNLEYE